MRALPNGYSIIEDDSYILKVGDLYGFKHWDTSERWADVINDFENGKSLKIINDNYKGKYTMVAATKSVTKRFPNSKPYPFGY